MTDHEEATQMTEKTATDAPSSTLEVPAVNKDASGTPSSVSENGDVEKAVEVAEPERSPRDIHGVKWAVAVFSVLIATFLFALGKLFSWCRYLCFHYTIELVDLPRESITLQTYLQIQTLSLSEQC